MYHHKEARPIDTITNIRNILADLDLLPIETWHNYVEGLFSLRLTIPDVIENIGVNGKGINKEFALASAYGELVERIQNQLLYPVFMYHDFDKNLEQAEGFEFDPEELKFSVKEVLERLPDIIIDSTTDDRDAFINSFYGFEKDFITCLPYYHYNSGQVVYYPKDSFFFYHGSNGMAAGNTLEEAVVQGLSEIFERHVMRAALYESVSFPEVDFSILQKDFPDELDIISRIEKATDFKIKVIDCSMQQRLPVIGIIVANNNTQRHFIKFGSHPDLHVGLERCLTELLQGRDICDSKNMVDFKLYTEMNSGRADVNFHNIFRDGWGYYPNSFFTKKPTYEVDEAFICEKRKSNGESLRQLLDVIDRNNWHLLIRDVSFLGFPTVSLCVPGISEVSKIDEQNVHSLHEAKDTAIILKNMSEMDPAQKEKVLEIAAYQGILETTPDIIKLINLPISREHAFSKVNTNLISVLLYLSMNDISKAIEFLDLYLNDKNIELSSDAVSYFRCARDYMIMMQDEGENKDPAEVLSFFYKSETVSKVIREFSSPDYLLKSLGILDCPNCSACNIKDSCSYSVIRDIHLKLKKKMKENPIDQTKVAALFC